MRCIAIVLIALLSTIHPIQAATPPDPHQFLSGMARETKINVTMSNGDRLAGRLGGVEADRFSLTVGKARNLQVRSVAYSDVRSVKRAGMRTSTKVLLVTGVVVVALAILVAIAAAQASLLDSL